MAMNYVSILDALSLLVMTRHVGTCDPTEFEAKGESLLRPEMPIP